MAHATHKTPNKMDYKQFGFEVKALNEDDDYHYFEGYLSTYSNVDRVGEVMDPKCFDESIKQFTPMLLWQHKSTEVVGVFTEVRSDETGLWVKGKMPKSDTLVSGRIFPQMKVGSVRAMSVGFIPEEWEYRDDIKHHTKVTLVEGSLVAFPANPNAKIYDMKSYNIEDVEEIKTKRDFEKLLRESGSFSNKAVVYLASRFQEDAEPQGEPDVFKSFLDEFRTLTNKMKEK